MNNAFAASSVFGATVTTVSYLPAHTAGGTVGHIVEVAWGASILLLVAIPIGALIAASAPSRR
jgi:hypothetical protein